MAKASLYRTKKARATKPRSPSKPIKVYWWMDGTRELYYSYLDYVDGDKVFYVDGGWNRLEHCFFSEEQARRNPCPSVVAKEVVATRNIVTELRRACHKAELDLREMDKQVSRWRGED